MTLTKKFAAYSLILIFISGIGTWLLVQSAVRDQALMQYRMDAKSALWGITHHMNEADFADGGIKFSDPDFAKEILAEVPHDHFDYLLIWGPDGKILFSKDASLIGKKPKIEDHLRRALNGETVIEETAEGLHDYGARADVKKDTPYLEIYSPIVVDGQVLGVFETSCDLAPLYTRIDELNVRIVGVLCMSLALLWLLLSGVVRQSSRTIDRQNTDLRSMNDEQAQALAKLEENYLGSLRSLAAAVEARDPYTSGHSQRTRSLSLLLGRELGLKEEQLDRLAAAAILHDIGKIGTPEAVLGKSTALTSDEWHLMKKHPVVGAQIVAAVPFLAHLAEIVRSHHENYDGTGYPDGLKGEQILVEARILAVTDAFDAIISNRPYRAGASIDETLKRVSESRGSKFDPRIADLLVDLFAVEGTKLEIERLYGAEFGQRRLVAVE